MLRKLPNRLAIILRHSQPFLCEPRPSTKEAEHFHVLAHEVISAPTKPFLSVLRAGCNEVLPVYFPPIGPQWRERVKCLYKDGQLVMRFRYFTITDASKSELIGDNQACC